MFTELLVIAIAPLIVLAVVSSRTIINRIADFKRYGDWQQDPDRTYLREQLDEIYREEKFRVQPLQGEDRWIAEINGPGDADLAMRCYTAGDLMEVILRVKGQASRMKADKDGGLARLEDDYKEMFETLNEEDLERLNLMWRDIEYFKDRKIKALEKQYNLTY